MRLPQHRPAGTAVVIAILALAGACTGGSAADEDQPSVQELADGELAGKDAVDRVDVSESPTDGTVDVSAIARIHGGGGHRRAAGFGSNLSYAELVDFLRAEVSAQIR